jgi:hypothetical protein
MFSMRSSPRLYSESIVRRPVCDLQTTFKLPYIYDYITKLCRQQAEVIQNHENANVHNIGQGEPRHRKYKRFKFGGGQAYDRSSVAVVAGATKHRT